MLIIHSLDRNSLVSYPGLILKWRHGTLDDEIEGTVTSKASKYTTYVLSSQSDKTLAIHDFREGNREIDGLTSVNFLKSDAFAPVSDANAMGLKQKSNGTNNMRTLDGINIENAPGEHLSLPPGQLHFPKLPIVASHEHVGEHDFVDDFFRFVKQGTEQKERGITEFGWLGRSNLEFSRN